MKINMGSLKSAAPLFVLIGLMIAFSAYVKSWALLYMLLASSVMLTVMISLPFLVSPLQHSKFIVLRILRLLVITLWAVGLVGVLFSVVERLVWVNADSYPSWLAKELDSPTITDGETFIKATESFEKTCGKNKGSSALSQGITACLCAAMIASLSTPGGRGFTNLKHLRLDDAFL